mmetsp:Transcript_73077/g.143316  ORF Transcript_73077/g.143316 Transcript_73077/m.143316 type:complete len:129 (-) Transcript_73077:73-459(-)|eukprot:CAMPEP_0170371750 /NCGR_PEP_ID=MMETSP0117_2-20130122/9195_1 /TAXON_ID=400756 /ORGANISM="Durinskia baltica, Strain CSIRO CS-38" /LENGTH=128 /DNA_ID=CAMNT_0010626581 /DNA_START=37 /DNA_END=423 /DNA_ORIENTATION=-
MSSGPIVQVDFVLNGISCNQINVTHPDCSTVNAISAESRASNTSFGYSGRHDHGDLPELKASGPHAILVAALQEAKKECDKYLTQRINAEYGYDGATDEKVDVEIDVEEDVESKAKKLCTEKSKESMN